MGGWKCEFEGCDVLVFGASEYCLRHKGDSPEENTPGITGTSENSNDESYRDLDFLKGLIIPTILPLTFGVLYFEYGPLYESEELFLSFAFSLCLWPVIGLSLASNNKIVESMREGGRVSAIIGLIIGSLLYFGALSVGFQYHGEAFLGWMILSFFLIWMWASGKMRLAYLITCIGLIIGFTLFWALTIAMGGLGV